RWASRISRTCLPTSRRRFPERRSARGRLRVGFLFLLPLGGFLPGFAQFRGRCLGGGGRVIRIRLWLRHRLPGSRTLRGGIRRLLFGFLLLRRLVAAGEKQRERGGKQQRQSFFHANHLLAVMRSS